MALHDQRPAEPRQPHAHDALAIDLEVMSPLEKIRLTSEMSVAAKTLAEAGICQRFPNVSERERFLRLAILTLGADLARLVYPDAASLLSSQ